MPKIQTPKFKRAVPTLDSEGALMNEQQREALGQSQLLEDTQAVVQRLTAVTKQIAEQETKLEQDRKTLADLRKERAGLIVAKKPIVEISSRIADLEVAIDRGPDVVAALREEQQRLQKDQSALERSALLDAQKDAAHQAEKLSRELVNLLEKALLVNTTLQACERNYVRLKEKTGMDIPMHVTHGSDGSLRTLFETCKAEVESGKQVRSPIRPGETPL